MATAQYCGGAPDIGPTFATETPTQALSCGRALATFGRSHVVADPGVRFTPRSYVVAGSRVRCPPAVLVPPGWQPKDPMRPSPWAPHAAARKLVAPATTPRAPPPSARGPQPHAALADAPGAQRTIAWAEPCSQATPADATKFVSSRSTPSSAAPSTRASSARSNSSGSSAPGADADDVGARRGSASVSDAYNASARAGSGVLYYGHSGAVWVRPATHSPREGAPRAGDEELLAEFLGLAQAPDVDAGSARLLLRTLRMLWCCNYAAEDVCSILAHASAYFHNVLAGCDGQMNLSEQGNVLVALIYLAHTWVVDETCALGVWHEHLFKGYCTLPTLNHVVFRLLEMRGFSLRVEEGDIFCRHLALMQAIAKAARRGALGGSAQH